ncbi:MAG: hypothetical protein JOZ52_09640 [Acidobacteria bacterium]|nr:hypothetical protein [Acidobacteriota bacterium]
MPARLCNRRLVLIALIMCLSSTLCTNAQVKSEAVPVMDGDGGCLMGGSSGGNWLKAEEMGKRMTGGDKYRLYDLKGLWKSVTGGKPESQGAPCEDTLYVELPKDFQDSIPAGSHYIGVAGTWNPLPRAPRIESNDNPTYRNLVASLLTQKGIRRPQVNITKVVRVDLEGDGTDEVIIVATRVHRFDNGSITPDPDAGDYSLVMLRKVINGKAQTIMLDEEYHPKAAKFTAPNEYDLTAVLDLDGDGVMEIIVAGGYYEGDWKTVYSIKGNKAIDVLGCGCGA